MIIEKPKPSPELVKRKEHEQSRLVQEGLGEREAALQARLKHIPVPD